MMDSGPMSVDITARKYRVLVELGQGGTANVFLAVARGPAGFNKLVVLKALKRTIANDADSRRMFLAEARLSARLNHPNIVQVNEVTEQDGVPVMVMEYLEGQPLSQLTALETEEFTLTTHLRVIADALNGLHYSHELTDYDGTPLNVVHRDMTPQNVFVTFDGVVKVLDFGIAKLAGAAGDTQTGVIKGKLRYMPPEQIIGDQIDRRADLFAVGAMLWEAAAGTRIWRDLGEATIMNNVINGRIPSPRSVRPECPSELEAICMKAMAHNREERYRTALELQVDVERMLATLGEQLTSHELGERVSRWFSGVRNETRKIIERKLTQEGSLSLTGAQKLSFPPPSRSVNTMVSRTDSDGLRRRPVLPLLLGTALLVLGGFAVWRLMTGSAQIAAPASSGIPSDAPPVEEAPKTVLVRVTVFPAEARILFDGNPVHSNPYDARFERDGSRHKVRAEAPGHLPVEREIEMTRDSEAVIVLEREPEPPTPTPAAPPPRVVRPAAPTGPKKPDCSSPYYVDERGVKKFRPECL